MNLINLSVNKYILLALKGQSIAFKTVDYSLLNFVFCFVSTTIDFCNDEKNIYKNFFIIEVHMEKIIF